MEKRSIVVKQKTNEDRRTQIETAAFELLREKGYRSTSMLQIAKRASASNQTLYSWYGNKQNLFQNLIEENGREVRMLLKETLGKEKNPLQVLRELGTLLLQFTTTEKAIIINRAAITEATEGGILAETIDRVARQEMVVMIHHLMVSLVKTGHFLENTEPGDAAESYISLLFGEVQMRQVMGRLQPLTEEEISRRSTRAFNLICRLYGKK